MSDLELLKEFCECFGFEYTEEELSNGEIYVDMMGDEFTFNEDGDLTQ